MVGSQPKLQKIQIQFSSLKVRRAQIGNPPEYHKDDRQVLSISSGSKAAKEAAGYAPNPRVDTEPQTEPELVEILTATTKSTIRQKMKYEWGQSWEKAKHGRELFALGVNTVQGQYIVWTN
jgi:hypothetical protein